MVVMSDISKIEDLTIDEHRWTLSPRALALGQKVRASTEDGAMRRRSLLLVAPGIAVAFMLLLASLVLAATFTLSGRVTDQTGTGIVGATIEALQAGTTTRHRQYDHHKRRLLAEPRRRHVRRASHAASRQWSPANGRA
jgi:protocatechuate 3,4-dioxygenase beta subunit